MFPILLPSCSRGLPGQVLEATRIPVDLDWMRRCLAEGHPIVFGLKLTQRFFRPQMGFCATPDPNDPRSASHGLHAMLLVGYNDRQSIFIVRNSWGTSWGDQGYGYLVALNPALWIVKMHISSCHVCWLGGNIRKNDANTGRRFQISRIGVL